MKKNIYTEDEIDDIAFKAFIIGLSAGTLLTLGMLLLIEILNN